MDVQSRFDIYSKINFNRKHLSSCSTNNISEQQTELQNKLTLLESQYVAMETQYSRKVKELKNSLAQKTRKQTSLIHELHTLKTDFKQHQEQISKVAEQLKLDQSRENQLKSSKKNSSPGLIKKSLDYERRNKQKQGSPVQKGKVAQINFGQVKKRQYGQNSSPRIKRASPRGNVNGILHLLKQDPINPPPPPILQKQSSGQEHHSGKKNVLKVSGQPRKKVFSPKSNQDAKGILNSMKVINKIDYSTAANSNGSPRRPIRRSPGEKGFGRLEVKKEGKKLLGGLKEEIEECF